MNTRVALRSLFPLFALTTLAVLVGCGSGTKGSSTTPPPNDPSPVQHIIFLSEENRSFDHYFGKLNDYRSAAPFNLPREVNGLPDDCSSSNSDWTVHCSAMNLSPDANGVPTTPIYAFHLKTSCIEGLSPDWIATHWDFNWKTRLRTRPPGRPGWIRCQCRQCCAGERRK